MTTITSINPVIGDESFVAAFGRLPTPFDDPCTRVATHVGYAARTLREREVSQLSQPQRTRRMRVLDALDQYVAAGVFPDSETDRDLLPTFLDPYSGVRCAVAHLVEITAGTATMLELDRDHHNDYIADLADDPRFVAWVETSGLTHEELAIIQPSYPPPPPPDLLYVIAAEGDLSVHDHQTTPDALTSFGMVDGSLRYVTRTSSFAGELVGDVVGKIGLTNGSHEAYDLGLTIGHFLGSRDGSFSYSLGLNVDAYGPDVPRAWTIPFDASLRVELGHTTFGLHGGPRFTVSGDRDRVGWHVGVDVRRRGVFGHNLHGYGERQMALRDVIVAFDITGIDDHVMLGLTVGVGNPRGRNWGDE